MCKLPTKINTVMIQNLKFWHIWYSMLSSVNRTGHTLTVILGLPVSLDDQNNRTIISPGCKSITQVMILKVLLDECLYMYKRLAIFKI